MTSSEHPVRVADAVRAWRAAQLGIIAWRAADGTPDAASVVPLTAGDTAYLALSYAQLDLARALHAATEVALGVGPGLAGDHPRLVVRGQAQVTEDPDGHIFMERGLLEMELAKHPPSRRRLDSLLERREHWWYVPRLLVAIDSLADARASVGAADAVLVTAGQSLDITICSIDAEEPLLLGGAGPIAGRRPAVVIEHGADLPDMERPWSRRWRGTWVDGRFETDAVLGDRQQAEPLTLRQRIRAERRLQRACRAGLRAAGHA